MHGPSESNLHRRRQPQVPAPTLAAGPSARGQAPCSSGQGWTRPDRAGKGWTATQSRSGPRAAGSARGQAPCSSLLQLDLWQAGPLAARSCSWTSGRQGPLQLALAAGPLAGRAPCSSRCSWDSLPEARPYAAGPMQLPPAARPGSHTLSRNCCQRPGPLQRAPCSVPAPERPIRQGPHLWQAGAGPLTGRTSGRQGRLRPGVGPLAGDSVPRARLGRHGPIRLPC